MHKLLLTIIVLSFIGCSPKNYTIGTYQNASITVDGNSADWEMPLRFGNTNGSLQYNITNDNEFVYVCVATSDENTKMKILRAGISIYIDVKGKKNKLTGITYPIKENQKNDFTMNRDELRNSSRFNQENNRSRKPNFNKSNSYKCFGFLNDVDGEYYLNANNPIKMSIDYDLNNNLVVEASIPIKNFYDKNLNATPSPNISLGIVLNNLMTGFNPSRNNTNRNYNMGGMNGGMRGGGMRGGGGMRSGGAMRGGSGMREGGNFSGIDRSGLSDSNENWYQFKLAIQ
jgi:uncharacterized membrane protein YgcG